MCTIDQDSANRDEPLVSQRFHTSNTSWFSNLARSGTCLKILKHDRPRPEFRLNFVRFEVFKNSFSKFGFRETRRSENEHVFGS